VHVSPAGEPVAQYALDDVEELGFLKVDVLGLRKLTIIEEAVGAAARDGYWLPPPPTTRPPPSTARSSARSSRPTCTGWATS